MAEPLDEEFDVIVLGTGLKECILSGLLSVKGKKVLHLDRNGYYGGEGATMRLEDLFQKFKPGEEIPDVLKYHAPAEDSKTDVNEKDQKSYMREYHVDLGPKFIMACGNLVKLLLHSKVTHYMSVGLIQASFTYKDGRIHKVPSTAQEALSSKLMGIFQKRRFKNFLLWVQDFDRSKRETWNCGSDTLDLNAMTMRQLYDYWKLDDNTAAFIGHSLALYTSDEYMHSAAETIPALERIQLYAYSVARYGNSPYIYPNYGSSDLPESFTRLAAVANGTYLLNAQIHNIAYTDDGKVAGVNLTDPILNEPKVIKCQQLIADPSYFKDTDKVAKVGSVVRWIVILEMNDDSQPSAQIVFPSRLAGNNKKHDIYATVLSNRNYVAPGRKTIITLSTTVETDDPRGELKPARDLIDQVFNGRVVFDDIWYTSDMLVPQNRDTADNVFISSSFDATSHYETTSAEAMELYKRITGEELDMSVEAPQLGE